MRPQWPHESAAAGWDGPLTGTTDLESETAVEKGSTMGAPLVLFVVLPIVLLLLFGLVMVIRGLFFGAKATGEGVEEHVDKDVGS